MPKIEVDLPDRIDGDIDRLVEDGEFVNREQAIEDLLTRGVNAYQTEEETEPIEEEELFTQTIEDQQDPAMRDDEGDDYTF